MSNVSKIQIFSTFCGLFQQIFVFQQILQIVLQKSLLDNVVECFFSFWLRTASKSTNRLHKNMVLLIFFSTHLESFCSVFEAKRCYFFFKKAHFKASFFLLNNLELLTHEVCRKLYRNCKKNYQAWKFWIFRSFCVNLRPFSNCFYFTTNAFCAILGYMSFLGSLSAMFFLKNHIYLFIKDYWKTNFCFAQCFQHSDPWPSLNREILGTFSIFGVILVHSGVFGVNQESPKISTNTYRTKLLFVSWILWVTPFNLNLNLEQGKFCK